MKIKKKRKTKKRFYIAKYIKYGFVEDPVEAGKAMCLVCEERRIKH